MIQIQKSPNHLGQPISIPSEAFKDNLLLIPCANSTSEIGSNKNINDENTISPQHCNEFTSLSSSGYPNQISNLISYPLTPHQWSVNDKKRNKSIYSMDSAVYQSRTNRVLINNNNNSDSNNIDQKIIEDEDKFKDNNERFQENYESEKEICQLQNLLIINKDEIKAKQLTQSDEIHNEQLSRSELVSYGRSERIIKQKQKKFKQENLEEIESLVRLQKSNHHQKKSEQLTARQYTQKQIFGQNFWSDQALDKIQSSNNLETSNQRFSQSINYDHKQSFPHLKKVKSLIKIDSIIAPIKQALTSPTQNSILENKYKNIPSVITNQSQIQIQDLKDDKQNQEGIIRQVKIEKIPPKQEEEQQIHREEETNEYQISKQTQREWGIIIQKSNLVQSLMKYLFQKVSLKKCQYLFHCCPLILCFFALLIYEVVNFCQMIIIVHFSIYLLLSIRNLIINLRISKSSDRIMKVLNLYSKKALLWLTFFNQLKELQILIKQQKQMQENDNDNYSEILLQKQKSIKKEQYDQNSELKNGEKNDIFIDEQLSIQEAFELSIQSFEKREDVCQILVKSSNLKNHEKKYYEWRKQQLNCLLQQDLELVDYIICFLQNFASVGDLSLIQKELDTVLKFYKYENFICISKIYMFIEEGYLVVYSIIQIQLFFCSDLEHKIAIVFGFYYSISIWINIIMRTFQYLFLAISFFFKILSVFKNRPAINAISFLKAKSQLSNSKISPLEFNDATCIICLESFKDKDKVYISKCCQKCYHQNCIKKWITNTPNCPHCRFQLQ